MPPANGKFAVWTSSALPAAEMLSRFGVCAACIALIGCLGSGEPSFPTDCRAWSVPLNCERDDCSDYAPIDVASMCQPHQSRIAEGLCGSYRFRDIFTGFEDKTTYWDAATGKIVAIAVSGDTGPFCAPFNKGVSGDYSVVEQCDAVQAAAPNLCPPDESLQNVGRGL